MILLHYTLRTFTLVAFLIVGLGYANLELNWLKDFKWDYSMIWGWYYGISVKMSWHRLYSY